MTDIYKAAQMALEALEWGIEYAENTPKQLEQLHKWAAISRAAVTTLRARLEKQPAEEQEPVGVVEYLMSSNDGWLSKLPPGTKLYTAPQPRRRLTREEIEDAVREADLDWHQGWTLDEDVPNRYETLCRAIEAAVWGEQT